MSAHPSRVVAVVVAGGTGERFGAAGGKQMATVAGMPVMSWSIKALDECEFGKIVVVCHPERVDEYRSAAVDPLEPRTPVVVVAGGDTRQDSVACGLAQCQGADVVVIHDGARPLVAPEDVVRAVSMLEQTPAIDGVVVGHPVVDTLKSVSKGVIEHTVDRSVLWSAQTPQVFRASAILVAHERAAEQGFLGTDDSSLVEHAGGRVAMIEGDRNNIKVTVPEDYEFVSAILAARAEGRL